MKKDIISTESPVDRAQSPLNITANGSNRLCPDTESGTEVSGYMGYQEDVSS
jgi:hypothetical protein